MPGRRCEPWEIEIGGVIDCSLLSGNSGATQMLIHG
jgi:hypothetical protein